MGIFRGPNLPKGSLKVLLDIGSPRCYQAAVADTGLPSGTKLYNLVSNSPISYFYNDVGSEAYQDVVEHNGTLVLRHNAYDGTNRDTTWRAYEQITRVHSYTVISWFKFDNSGQQSENIYGGGFDGNTSFYMSPSGTSESHGYLIYSDAGSTNGFSLTSNYGANDGNWHMRAYTKTGPDVGVQTAKFYVDGVIKGTSTSNSSHDDTDGLKYMRWGSWTGGYGNMEGDLNHFMYYERVLSDDEILQVYNATKTRYQ
jgi:hypothetical protein